MKTSPLAGKPVAPGMLINVPKLITAYYSDVPDAAVAAPLPDREFGLTQNLGRICRRVVFLYHPFLQQQSK